jgi:CelD/BcsL family acetyltransferase involved in cellulose biosynthesis
MSAVYEYEAGGEARCAPGRADASATSPLPPGSPRVSVVIPAKNEARNLPWVLEHLPGGLHEVILVDGGSVDDTVAVACEHRPDIVVVRQTRRGKGNALACGFAACTGEVIVMLDADGSAHPAEISDFLRALTSGADFAKGSRFLTGGGSSDLTRLRSAGNGFLNFLTNRLYRTSYTDLCYGYNAFWARCVKSFELPPVDGADPVLGDGFEIETLITVRVGAARLAVTEVPSYEHDRIHGESNLNTFRDGWRVLRTLLRERFRPKNRKHRGRASHAAPSPATASSSSSTADATRLRIVGGSEAGAAGAVSESAAVESGRWHRPRDSAQISVARITTPGELAALLPEWRDLYENGASLNPYASPDWMATWLAHFVRAEDLAVTTVRREGRLIGLAPTYVRRLGGVLQTVQLAGTMTAPGLTELPQILTATGETRSVLRAVLRHWAECPRQWDWLELPLDANQGWFEPQWLGEGRSLRGLVRHKTTRASVVLPLFAIASSTAGALKRNVWESVKRSRNRLNRSGVSWNISVHCEPADIAAAMPELRRLHAARSTTTGRRTHPDMLGDPAHYDFFAEAVGRMAAAGRAELLTLDAGSTPIAAQLVLRAPAASYLALSGVDPEWWHASPVTLLQYTAIGRAAERGDREMNLSVGPDVSKLRWSEQVVQHPEFVVCGSRDRSRRLLAAYSALSALASVQREAARHQVLCDAAGEAA